MDPITLYTSAFTAIKSGVEVGKQLTDLSHQIIKFVGGMSKVEEEHKKKNNIKEKKYQITKEMLS